MTDKEFFETLENRPNLKNRFKEVLSLANNSDSNYFWDDYKNGTYTYGCALSRGKCKFNKVVVLRHTPGALISVSEQEG